MMNVAQNLRPGDAAILPDGRRLLRDLDGSFILPGADLEESATLARASTSKGIHEVADMSAAPDSSGRMRVLAISAGLGSSGYYSPRVLQEAATAGLIGPGTFLYLDHPTRTQRSDRPERSVRDIAAVFTEAATWDDAEQGLVGPVQVFAPYRDLLTEMGPHIGLSITGSATDVTEGEHDGRRVPIVEGLAAIDSVDFVTKAGRGGRVLELLESYRLGEAPANATRDALSDLVKATHAATPNGFAWVQDYDPDTGTVWFEVEQPTSNPRTYAQSYTGTAPSLSLIGVPVEVRRTVTYVPVNPAGVTTTSESKKEDTMGNIEIDEAEHARLIETVGRVETLEAENARMRAEAQAQANRQAAMDVITESKAQFTDLEVRGLLSEAPTHADGDQAGRLDVEAFTTTVTEAAKAKTKTAATGQVTGFGASRTVTETHKPTRSPWGRDLTEKGA